MNIFNKNYCENFNEEFSSFHREEKVYFEVEWKKVEKSKNKKWKRKEKKLKENCVCFVLLKINFEKKEKWNKKLRSNEKLVLKLNENVI